MPIGHRSIYFRDTNCKTMRFLIAGSGVFGLLYLGLRICECCYSGIALFAFAFLLFLLLGQIIHQQELLIDSDCIRQSIGLGGIKKRVILQWNDIHKLSIDKGRIVIVGNDQSAIILHNKMFVDGEYMNILYEIEYYLAPNVDIRKHDRIRMYPKGYPVSNIVRGYAIAFLLALLWCLSIPFLILPLCRYVGLDVTTILLAYSTISITVSIILVKHHEAQWHEKTQKEYGLEAFGWQVIGHTNKTR